MMFSRTAFVSRTRSRPSLSTATIGLGCSTANENTNNNNNNNETDNNKKPQSRLARLAEDWLEEEEDELQLYWERFDKNKSGNKPDDASQATSKIYEDEDDEDDSLTTEQRLERYYDRRGINKRREQEHTTAIQQALENAKKAATPEQAILFLTEVQPWLQINSKLGGTALLELAIALWQRDGNPDEALCEELLGNSHVRREVQLLLKSGPPKRKEEMSLWNGLSFFDQNGWWN